MSENLGRGGEVDQPTTRESSDRRQFYSGAETVSIKPSFLFQMRSFFARIETKKKQFYSALAQGRWPHLNGALA